MLRYPYGLRNHHEENQFIFHLPSSWMVADWYPATTRLSRSRRLGGDGRSPQATQKMMAASSKTVVIVGRITMQQGCGYRQSWCSLTLKKVIQIHDWKKTLLWSHIQCDILYTFAHSSHGWDDDTALPKGPRAPGHIQPAPSAAQRHPGSGPTPSPSCCREICCNVICSPTGWQRSPTVKIHDNHRIHGVRSMRTSHHWCENGSNSHMLRLGLPHDQPLAQTWGAQIWPCFTLGFPFWVCNRSNIYCKQLVSSDHLT